MIDNSFEKAFLFYMICAIVLAVLTGVGGFFTIRYFTRSLFESSHIITPKKKLTIKDNKVDTIYIYKFK